ncbi:MULTISPECIES: hypothetical protein [unclassified Acinetobacter]|uniref:hypothetical protein n=1 Tax=unclassified Acinetobacter TaxID=196816 RepID=UPI0029345B32|nr:MULTISPECIES: hypothetical protein [unclassified Acinetobacter]WOE31024.1 hypothetical protein QSG84_11825 [Acinetobacter sp. SAAs470]WOE39220.1 hypothetical protein QSG86_05490 [Acinetobacter sp. SAAs474]
MFKPFQNGVESDAIHDLTIENNSDYISLYGNLQLTKDQQGLVIAKKLQAFLNSVVIALESEENLPEHISIKKMGEVENPFF